MLKKIREELASFLPKEQFFIFFIMLADFLISFEYGMTRPASNSLFLSVFSSKDLPWVWLMTVPLNLGLVTLYTKFVGKIGPLKMFLMALVVIACFNGITALALPSFPWIIFLQFAFKDIYILFLFKQLWSLVHTTIEAKRAKYVYGMIFGMGTLGSVAGGLISGFFAVDFGSKNFLFLTLPAYLVLWVCYKKAYGQSSMTLEALKKPKEKLQELFRSPFIIAVLLLVVLMQVSVALMEFQFNTHLETHILDKDLRTEYVGKMFSIVNVISAIFQFVGSFVLLHTIGLRKSHLFLPAILLFNALTQIAFPSFAVITCAFAFIKAIDFSLFGVLREMLYLPMQLDEKFRAKAVIDIFAYRTAKALVALSILGLQFFAGSQIIPWVNSAIISVFVLWLMMVWFLLRKHYQPEKLY